MKSFMKFFVPALKLSLVMGILCCVLYPGILTALGQLLFPHQANGSIIEVEMNGEKVAVGSELVGQQFDDPRFFHGRVSSVGYNVYTEEEKEDGTYGGVSSGSFNYGNSNPDLAARVEEDLKTWMAEHPDVKQEDIPSDLLTASGSGLDPHITPQAAEVQVSAVAKASGLSEDEVRQIVADNTEGKVLGIFGENRVNVLKCNLDIAEKLGMLTQIQ